MIFPTSRYANSKLVIVKKDNGTNVQVIVPSNARSFTFNYVFYTFGGQDRVDTIAEAFYGDPKQWWRIGDANPEILDWSSVSPGTHIRIPNV